MERLPRIESRKNRSREAWLSLGFAGLWLAATLLRAAVHGSPWNSILFPLLVILSLVAALTFAIRAQKYWPARIALLLICAFIIILPIVNLLRLDPSPTFKDQISKGMTLEEVKAILGEPDKSERLDRLVRVPVDVPLYDDEGNLMEQDYLVKSVEGDRVLHFKNRRTVVVVRFDENDRVKHCSQHSDIRGVE